MTIPLSTKIRSGSWYVNFVFQEKEIVANLAQARVMSSQRLYNKQGELSENDARKIKDAFIKLYS